MAIDTRNRRASCLGFALAALVILPAPDAVIDASDRQQVSMAYAGLAANVPPPSTVRIIRMIGSTGVPVRGNATVGVPVRARGSVGIPPSLPGSRG